jgi:hypothetical protein
MAEAQSSQDGVFAFHEAMAVRRARVQPNPAGASAARMRAGSDWFSAPRSWVTATRGFDHATRTTSIHVAKLGKLTRSPSSKTQCQK